MANKPTSKVQGAPQPGAQGHEPRDASVPWIFGIVVFLICSVALIEIALGGLLNRFKHHPAPTDYFQPIRQAVPSVAGSFPRLQVAPRLDLAQFRAREDEQLTNYGWIDPASGIVRVPIERAMERVLQKGLPVRTNSDNRVGPSPTDLIQERSLHRQPEIQGEQ
jgi:hypothetical protein